MSSRKKMKLSPKLKKVCSRELNILDLKLDNLLRIFHFCSPKDKTRIKLACKDFFEAFKYSWSGTSRVRTRMLHEKKTDIILSIC